MPDLTADLAEFVDDDPAAFGERGPGAAISAIRR